MNSPNEHLALTNFLNLIENYKGHIKSGSFEPELYKWQCAKHYSENFDINAKDFNSMLKRAMRKTGNLLYQNSSGFIEKASRYFPEIVRKMFAALYEENNNLQSRIDDFQNSSKVLLPKVIAKHEKALKEEQDERTISFYLSMMFPDKYPLFKNDIYNLLLSVCGGEEPKKSGYKLKHYVDLAKPILPAIASDTQINELIKARLNNDCYSGDQKWLLFQDILWHNRDQTDNLKIMKYYLLGAYWKNKEEPDQTQRFVKNGTWENGWDDKFSDSVNTVAAGSRVAIKASFVKGKRDEGQTSALRIKAIGTVNMNHKDGQTLGVNWDKDFNGEFDVDFSGNYRSTIHEITNPEHIQAIFFRNQQKGHSKAISDYSKNIILYGPPGTGKTYNSIDMAVEIATGQSSKHPENKMVFDTLRKEGQIEFVTFHQNYSYEDFMVGLKPDVEYEKLRFKTHRGVFYELCKKAKENHESYTSGKGKKKTFEEVFEEVIKPLEKGNEVEIKMISGISFWITEVSDKAIYFRKQSGGTAHSLSISSLKELVEGIRDTPSGLVSYYTPLINLIKEKRETKDKTEPIRNFVLVIDEINRANISKVFGELITLLEDDKRLGEENELKITLPNGEKEFGVPPNLYLIGTMNTADKSIALIDIALRRRFEFLGYYPKYEGYDSDASSLLQKINEAVFKEKKSADYLIGHAYFMKNQPIKSVLQNKVVPLLMEYFSGKTEIVSKIFTETNWNVNYNTTNYTWDISPK